MSKITKKLNNFFFLAVIGVSSVYANNTTEIVTVKEGYNLQDLGLGLEKLFLKLQTLENNVSKNSTAILENKKNIDEKILIAQEHINKIQNLENKVSKNSTAILENKRRIEKLFSLKDENNSLKDENISMENSTNSFLEQDSIPGMNKVIVCSNKANIRSTPKILKSNKNVVSSATRGEELEYTKKKNKWFYLTNGNYIHDTTCKVKK